ncbi:UDP-N-acetylmuramate dehydrogenase [Ornithinimicrobium avium]|uniref:Uncharacterized protein n=1 Tax=Ornithinimicrobium avium TaxID=2283195 RepID=A0A345NPL4_9MICO|nr:hypothetical protein [Ornithinimicrobium avium]AXH96972.1 hypothetical protein DV701_13350 [Ornithinimicrobium avium]
MQTASPSSGVLAGIVVDDSACDVDDLSPCGGVRVTVPGEQRWDELVELAVGSEWPGLELLSGVPGTVAEVVRANVAAHGQEPSGTVASVRTWDRSTDAQRTFAWGDCRFGPGTSQLQETLPGGRGRYQILDVTFLFKQGDLTAPVRDAQLAALLGVRPGHRVPITAVRSAVLADRGQEATR